MRGNGLLSILLLVCLSTVAAEDKPWVRLQNLVIVSPFLHQQTPEGEAARMLTDMLRQWNVNVIETDEEPPNDSIPILFLTKRNVYKSGYETEQEALEAGWESRPEGYRLWVNHRRGESPHIWIVGADPRGTLYGVGGFIRSLRNDEEGLATPSDLNIASAPAYPLRGHQLGYRPKANTYDAWSVEIYEQYIRDLILFGTNAIENIPFEDPIDSPHLPLPRAQMNVALSELCFKYGIEYWLWMPVQEHRDEDAGKMGLSSQAEQAKMLSQWRDLFEQCPRLDAVFVPSSDPGLNKASLLMPFLEQAARTLQGFHPDAKIWMSHQGFRKEDLDFVYQYLEEKKPEWFGGIAFGPWSQTTFSETRARLPQRYGLRSYPDITHTSRAQFPVMNWDRAFDHTIGRESINPRPAAMKAIHNQFAPDTIGFITYSDGVHDDVNKFLWSALGWNPDQDARDILLEYGCSLIDPAMGYEFADAVLALERNWDGPLADNGAVDGTLRLWQDLEQQHPEAAETNWRFQALLFRAYYDAHVRHRLIYEQYIEEKVNSILAEAGERWDAAHTMFRAEEALRQADREPVHPDWKETILYLADKMFALIGHQTGVDRHGASDYDRGTMLDTLDHPLNNRWWLEDEFAQIRQMPSEEEQVTALQQIPRHENPTPDTLYDDLGNIAAEPHVVRLTGESLDPNLRYTLSDELQSWEPYVDRRRLSQQDGIGCYPHWSPEWELALQYSALRPVPYTFQARVQKDEHSRYALLADGVEIKSMGPPNASNEIEIYEIPAELTKDGTLKMAWKVEEGVGIQVMETWLVKSSEQ